MIGVRKTAALLLLIALVALQVPLPALWHCPEMEVTRPAKMTCCDTFSAQGPQLVVGECCKIKQAGRLPAQDLPPGELERCSDKGKPKAHPAIETNLHSDSDPRYDTGFAIHALPNAPPGELKLHILLSTYLI